MLNATCHCGAMRLAVDAPITEVTDCNCSICRRYGVLWAYVATEQVTLGGPPTETYEWDDRAIKFHRCRACGCVTHWSANAAGATRMGINARLLPIEILATVRVRHLDGANTEEYLD